MCINDYSSTISAKDGASHLNMHILELFYVQQAGCICNTDRVTELRVGRRDQYCKSNDQMCFAATIKNQLIYPFEQTRAFIC